MRKLRGAIYAATLALTSVAQAQTAESKTAEQVYKNITQLKATPADQLLPAMQFIASSLGVNCEFCHVQGKMEADDKPPKKMAREMMAMTALLNKNNFGGRQEATCYTCHRGASRPVNVPPVMESDAPPRITPAASSTATVDQIVEKYLSALGGPEAIRKINSRVQKGSIVANGTETPIEVITKAPNQRISISHTSNGDSFTAFDGTAGWLGNTGRPAREMTAPEAAAAGIDAEFYLGLRLKEMFPQLRRGRPELINGVECETLNGNGAGRPAVRLSFDRKSGLLMRMVRFAETPLGRNPTQVDYADYREVDGVKTPFRWTLSRPNGRFTIQIADVKTNVPVDDARFKKPGGEVK